MLKASRVQTTLSSKEGARLRSLTGGTLQSPGMIIRLFVLLKESNYRHVKKREALPEELFLTCFPRGMRAIKNSMMKRKNSLGTARRQYSKLIQQPSSGKAVIKQETLLSLQNKIIPLMITQSPHTRTNRSNDGCKIPSAAQML